MRDADSALTPPPGTIPNEMFPVLTSGQQARVLAHGQRHTVEQGEIVVELNEHVTKVFVVVSGQLHILQVSNHQEHVVAVCNPGMFPGELNVLSGRRGLVRIRASEPSELIEIEREVLQALVETDSELSDIFLRAFILRRLELIAREVGDIVLIGSTHSLDTLRIKGFLTRNYQPYSYIDLERDTEVQEMIDLVRRRRADQKKEGGHNHDRHNARGYISRPVGMKETFGGRCARPFQ